MNTLPNMYKLFHYNLTMSPIYLVKLKITPNQPTAYAMHSVEPIVPDFCRKSFNIRFFPVVRKFLKQSSDRKIFYILVGFIKIYFQTPHGYF